MYCTNCGKELSKDTKFCGHCGQSTQVLKANNAKETSPLEQTSQTTAEKTDNTPKSTKPKKKKKGCLIAFIIVAVIGLLAVGLIVVAYLLPDDDTHTEKPVSIEQSIDIDKLITPADLRGQGLHGYWIGTAVLDPQGYELENTGEQVLIYFGDNNECTMRIWMDDEYLDSDGTYRDDSVLILTDDIDESYGFTMDIMDDDLYLELDNDSEEFVTLVFEGPYSEEGLLYQNLEYLKASAFTTSAMLEGQDSSTLTFEQWQKGIDSALENWLSLYRASKALDFAVDLDAESSISQRTTSISWPNRDISLGSIAYAGSAYDVKEVQGVIDRATSTTRIKKLAEHLNVSAEEAAQVLYEVQNNINKQAYKDEMFYGKCETYARRISTGSKATLLICGTALSGGTLALGEGVIFFIQGADLAMEINENEAYIAYEIEGKQSAKKALEGLSNARKWTAPASSIVGLKGMTGNGFDKFMVLKDTIFDAVDGKVCAISVINEKTGKMEVVQIPPEQLDQWKKQQATQGYKLTSEDKNDIWKEIYERAEELEAEENATLQDSETPAPSLEATPEPTVEPAPETDVDTSHKPSAWIKTWVVVGTGVREGDYYHPFESKESYKQMSYALDCNEDMTVHASLMDLTTGEQVEVYDGRAFQFEDDIVIIEPAAEVNDFIFTHKMRCQLFGEYMYLEVVDNNSPYYYALLPVEDID